MKVLILNPGSSSLRYALISADPPTGDQVRGKELLANSHVEHALQNPEFLVHGGWFHEAVLHEPRRSRDSNSLPQSVTQVALDLFGIDVRQCLCPKDRPEMFDRT